MENHLSLQELVRRLADACQSMCVAELLSGGDQRDGQALEIKPQSTETFPEREREIWKSTFRSSRMSEKLTDLYT